MKRYLLLCFVFLGFIQCFHKTETIHYTSIVTQSFTSKKSLNKDFKKNWYYKDIIEDSIPGISLEKAYSTILKNKNGIEVVVAVIDMPIDINHEDLKNNIWVNKKEIPNNGIDDDQNGYIDDIHGWNFLGNQKGETNKFVNYEYTRIIKKYDSIYKSPKNILNDSVNYSLYLKAKQKYEDQLIFAKEDSSYIEMVSTSKKEAENYLKKFLKTSEYNQEVLDSIKDKFPNDSILKDKTLILKNFITYGFSNQYILDYKLKADQRLKKLLNLNYNDRKILGDNPNSLNDKNYGNNKVDSEIGFFDHGTLMAGMIASVRNNKLGTQGFSDKIKIMCLPVSSFGNEHDKDIALAIKYAVDNGAKVINMSIGKEFSLYKEWVFNALKYADEHDVLIVSGGGNSSYNLNKFDHYYPNDNENNEKEVSKNFIKVGASSYLSNENLVADFSNYGSYDIDIFAPGVDGYSTTSLPQKYKFVFGGTSMSSAITSGVAALLFSHFPNLKAIDVKNVILDSGVEFTFNVKVPSENKQKELSPFSELSKSGKVVNAYNALLLAEQVSKSKN
ncbi:S8 family serine peptidase [Aquimarina aggregata]|uniref:S8 family serine peptidase n=1 Tax=Aquimarina aggregata TaxID=1642818 RepID=UPI0024916773|nr:S8 family serine peptidase [Aquimarina aggregata]